MFSPDGKTEPKSYKLSGTGFYAYIQWSPDSKKNGENVKSPV